MMKKLISTLVLSACSFTALATQPKNIIMIVGDGMGPAYTTAYRYFKDNPDTPMVEETIFDKTLVGMSSTYPARVSGYVTDSAAGATALATGHKTYNGAIALTTDKKPVETVLERAKKLGKSIGVVVTSQVNHATPAGYLAHNENRRNYDEIADSYVDNGWKTDILLGGGWKYFIREDRNLVKELQQQGVEYVSSYRELAELNTKKPVLGLFADKGLPWALDDENSERLSAMTEAAINHLTQLKNPNGFFMMIEGSQIDWGGHGNDIVDAMAEMNDLAQTLNYLYDFVKQHPDTLVVVTADHSTGGLTIAANGKYEWNPEIIRAMVQSPNAIAKQLAKRPITPQLVKDLFNFELNGEELEQLISAKEHPHKDMSHNIYADKKATTAEQALLKTIKHIINVRTNTGWTSSGHTAIDVPVFAFGANKTLFNGYQDDTDIAKKIFSLLAKEKK